MFLTQISKQISTSSSSKLSFIPMMTLRWNNNKQFINNNLNNNRNYAKKITRKSSEQGAGNNNNNTSGGISSSSSIESLLEEYEQRAKQYETTATSNNSEEKKPRRRRSSSSIKKSPNTSIILNSSTNNAELEEEEETSVVSELNLSNMQSTNEGEEEYRELLPSEIPTVELNEDFSERYPEDSFKLLTEEEVRRLLTIEEVCNLLDSNFGLDLVVMDLREKCSFAEYLVFVTGSSHRHMKTLAKSVIKELTARKLFKLKPTIEGESDANWMVVDAGNIIVQVFSPEGRRVVDLERKWSFHSKKDFEPTLEELANALSENPKRRKKK